MRLWQASKSPYRPSYAGENTRVIGFSPDGLLVYVGLFSTTCSFVVKKFMRGIVTRIDRDPTELPEGFTLVQSYPNPFNPQTTIEYEMKDAGLATLKVYDVLGYRPSGKWHW